MNGHKKIPLGAGTPKGDGEQVTIRTLTVYHTLSGVARG